MSFLTEALDARIQARKRIFPQHQNRCSQAGVECSRRLQWSRTRWDKAAPTPDGLQRAFDLGTALEPVIVRWLEEAGIEIEQRQRDLRWEQLELTGHIDGIVKHVGGRAVLEIKTTSRASFAKIRRAASAAELLEDRRSYVRGYVVQAGLYALLLGLPDAYLLFVCKDSGEAHDVRVSLSDDAVLAAAERFLRRIEAVNAAIANGIDLPAEPGAHCKDCPLVGECKPEIDFGPGVTLVVDETLEALLEKRASLADAKDEFEAVDADLKQILASPGEMLCGRWHVVVKEGQTTKYEVPKEVKAQFAVKVSQVRRSYEALLAAEVAA